MSINFDRFNNSDITHWAATPNGYGGFNYTAPTLLAGRWEGRIEKMVTLDGEEFVSKATVWVSADVTAGDFLYEGDARGIADPSTLAGAYRVQVFSKIPDIAGTNFERKAIL